MGNGTTFGIVSGATLRDSIGLGASDAVAFDSLTLADSIDVGGRLNTTAGVRFNDGSIQTTAFTGNPSAISSLNGLTAGTQTFAAINDSNITLAINSSGGTHTITAGFTGELSDNRVSNSITLTNLTQITNRSITDTTGVLSMGRGGTGVMLSNPGQGALIGWNNNVSANGWIYGTNGIRISGNNIETDINNLTLDNAPDSASDYVMTYEL